MPVAVSGIVGLQKRNTGGGAEKHTRGTKNDRNGGVWQSRISKSLAEYAQRHVCFEVVFIFVVIFIFEVVFIFKVVFIFEVVFVFEVVFILRLSSI